MPCTKQKRCFLSYVSFLKEKVASNPLMLSGARKMNWSVGDYRITRQLHLSTVVFRGSKLRARICSCPWFCFQGNWLDNRYEVSKQCFTYLNVQLRCWCFRLHCWVLTHQCPKIHIALSFISTSFADQHHLLRLDAILLSTMRNKEQGNLSATCQRSAAFQWFPHLMG